MAIKATVYRASLQIADMDRGVYADHTLTLARQPSAELQFSQNVEYLTAKRRAGLFELFEEGAVNIALAGFFGNEVPEVTDLSLSDAVDTAETLLDPVRVPWQVVVDH